MSKPTPVVISGAVEGPVDAVVLARLIGLAGAQVGPIHVKNGKARLLQRLGGYNSAARISPWAVLVDLDDDCECAPPIRQAWLADPSPWMCLRIAVRQVEAWLMADAEALADFLGTRSSLVPADPEAQADAKRLVVRLAARSRRRAIREDMIPREGSLRAVGPAFSSRLIEFAQSSWRPQVAEARADSLRRCRPRLKELVASYRAR
jgi:hypothetical protein